MTVFVVAFLAIIFPLAVFDKLNGTLAPERCFTWFTVVYWSTALASILSTWFIIRRRLYQESALPVIRSMYALVPLAVGVHVAYQMKFLPVLPGLTIQIYQVLPGIQNTDILEVCLLKLAMALVLLSGMTLTLVCLWKIIKGEAKFEQDNGG